MSLLETWTWAVTVRYQTGHRNGWLDAQKHANTAKQLNALYFHAAHLFEKYTIKLPSTSTSRAQTSSVCMCVCVWEILGVTVFHKVCQDALRIFHSLSDELSPSRLCLCMEQTPQNSREKHKKPDKVCQQLGCLPSYICSSQNALLFIFNISQHCLLNSAALCNLQVNGVLHFFYWDPL